MDRRVLYPEEKAREMAEKIMAKYKVKLDRAYTVFGVDPEDLVRTLRLFAQAKAPFLEKDLPLIEARIRQEGWTVLALGIKGYDIYLFGSRDEIVPLPTGAQA